jgi:hypothetical protein
MLNIILLFNYNAEWSIPLNVDGGNPITTDSCDDRNARLHDASGTRRNRKAMMKNITSLE